LGILPHFKTLTAKFSYHFSLDSWIQDIFFCRLTDAKYRLIATYNVKILWREISKFLLTSEGSMRVLEMFSNVFKFITTCFKNLHMFNLNWYELNYDLIKFVIKIIIIILVTSSGCYS
jgi:hypothetical protein